MSRLGMEMEYSPAMLWAGDFCEKLDRLDEAVWWYKIAADCGNAEGARCYADMRMFGYACEIDYQEALEYYKIASEKGIAEASFGVGKILRNNGN